MSVGVRAAIAVIWLIGFYLIGVMLLAGALALDVVMAVAGNPLALVVGGLPFTAAVILVVGRAFYASLRLRGREPGGVAVLESEQPALWAAVRGAAAVAGTAPPTALWIDSEFNASVFERTRWLGLRTGRRSLVIGAPMLVAYSPTGLDVILAHEFGHFAHRDTRLMPTVMRGRAGLAGAMNAATFFTTSSVSNGRWLIQLQWLIVRLIRGYAVRFLAVTQRISRAQEYAADRISAELCGREAAACVIGEMPAYAAAYHHFRKQHADVAAGLGLVPPAEAQFAGFGRMLAEPRWLEVVAKERAAPSVSARRPDKFDSHPPVAERVAAIRALPDDGRARDTSEGSAVSLLADADALLTSVADREKQRSGKDPADWDALVDAAARVQARLAAKPLADAMLLMTRAEPALSAFFDRVEAGEMETVLYRLLNPAQARFAPPGAVALELGRKTLARSLPAWITVELAEVGLVRWRHSWSTAAVREPATLPEGVGGAITALLESEPPHAAGAAATLRAALRDVGLEL